MVERCELLAKELESFRVMPNCRIRRMTEQICTWRYSRADFEERLKYVGEMDYKYDDEIENHELSHYWESVKMKG